MKLKIVRLTLGSCGLAFLECLQELPYYLNFHVEKSEHPLQSKKFFLARQSSLTILKIYFH